MNKQGEISTSSDRSELERRMRGSASAVVTELHLEGKLCDAVIKVDDAEFKVHKIILCGCSSYFRALFTGAWANSKEHYTIPGVSPEMMQLIINYAYTHSVTVTEENVVELLGAGDQFLVPGIVQACRFFLEDQMCLRNCIGIWRLVDFYYCPELRQNVFYYILHNFEDIIRVSQELVELSVEQLAALIENDHLNVKREHRVFDVVVRWINHLPDQRRGHISVLLPKVRLGFMPPSCVHNFVLTNALIKDNIECESIINDAMTAYDNAKKHSKFIYTNPMNRPRLPSAILLAIGGNNGVLPATTLEVYDVRADSWVTLNTDRVLPAHHGAAVLNNFVYLIGGRVREDYLNKVLKFDIVTRTWHKVAPMFCRRCYVSVAVQNGRIYAMGGSSGYSHHRSVECYNPETDQWSMIASMNHRRSEASSATLNGKVYICGGFNGQHSLSTAESFDPNSRQWTMITCMRSRRTGLGVAAYRGCIYAVGGCNSGSAEFYNPRTNRWNLEPFMRSPRSHFGIGVMDDELFAVGGSCSSTDMLDVERYDQEAGLWYPVASLEMPRSGLSCSVLHGLYSVTEKLFPRSLMLPDEEELQEDTPEPQLSPHSSPVTP